MSTLSRFIRFLKERDVRLRPPAGDHLISAWLRRFHIPYQSLLSEMYRMFDGFENDIDGNTMLNIWPIDEALSFSDPVDTSYSLVPFADYSFRTDIYMVDVAKDLIFSNNREEYVGVDLDQFLNNWINGLYDFELGLDVHQFRS